MTHRDREPAGPAADFRLVPGRGLRGESVGGGAGRRRLARALAGGQFASAAAMEPVMLASGRLG